VGANPTRASIAGLPAYGVMEALRRYAGGESIRDVKKNAKLSSFRQARRIWTWHASGVARHDLKLGKVVLQPGYRWIASGSRQRPFLRLIRSDPV
jgi:hypothetical protein